MGSNVITGLTCSDILLIPDLKEAVLLAGAGGLGRYINRVNVMEVPDVIDWVRPGEFLITSGFPFHDQPELLAEIIPQLNQKGVSALGIKTKRYIAEVPARALELADQLDFPIFELPAATSFSDVVRDIMERVLVQEARELSQLQSRFHKLSKQLLHGDGIEDFLLTLDGMLHNPVFLLDDTDQVFCSPQAEALELGEQLPAWMQLRQEGSLGITFLTVGERRIRAYVSAVNDKGADQCLLVLLEWNRELSVVDQLTIDRVGVLVGLEMINAGARREVELKYVDQFLQDWISGRIAAAEDLKLRGEACGCPLPERPLRAVTVGWLEDQPELKQLQQVVKRVRARADLQHVKLTILEGELVLTVPDQPELPLEETLGRLLAEMNRVFVSETCAFCIGDLAEGPDQVRFSYESSRKIARIRQISGYSGAYVDYRKLGVFRLLYHLPELAEISEYRDQYVAPLLEYDSKHNASLLLTLQLYFKCNRNIKRTSAELFTHYNTVTYRIDRACELLGLSQDDGDDMLELQLALKLHEMGRGRRLRADAQRRR
ncbi:PucR family transcriptional regulator ligand-binding domain-containing protein [Paenibacillus tritici]|uniref:PucR family transcriptional regulator n=1 Tax=Paenibacillus tritici TaxID=1873425 RepID=UPI001BA66A53|nr:PucR family transcriptional regulator ligand-binding domain-containing protein [Paenibacillus tritici]QUL54711.1 PucR family transcriptional regulator ligand-binding domain-containing protein [Paenibacillus tritici]